MKILALVATGVRNLEPLTLIPRARFNVFVGDNGQGKTNLLEAIFAVAALRSFRTAKLAELIAFGAPEATLGARVEKSDLTRVYEVDLTPGSRRVRLDGKAARPLARYFGAFNVVVFTPEDLGLARGAPADRRRFLDRGVFNLRPGYLATTSDYEKVLKQRNSVLRQVGQGAMSRAHAEELLDIYDSQLAQLGVALAQDRVRFLDVIRPALLDAFAAITRTGHEAGARYVSFAATSAPAELEAKLREGRARDLATGSTHTGPHRDDLVLELDGRDAGSFASQGQLRAIMLAWKSAELSVLGRAHGDAPILLLDDVSSELDPSRNEYLFQHLAEQAAQCFITTTSGAHVLLDKERADYRIESGRIDG